MPWDPEFQTAIRKGDLERINKLMDNGADPNVVRDRDGITPLCYAVQINAGPVIKAIVEHGNFKYTSNTNLAVLVTVVYDHPEFTPIILNKHTRNGPPLDTCKYDGETPCWIAQAKGYADAFALLVEHGAIPKPTTIHEDDLEIGYQKLGSGMFGTLYLATWNGRKVAVKNFKDKVVGVDEANAMSSLQHPNIVAFYGIKETGTTMSIAMEYMDNGNLEEYLRKNPRKNERDFLTVYRMLFDIAQAVTYLHENRTLHLDIKGPNILLNQQLSAKLCDFNTSVKLPPDNDVYDYVTATNNVRQVSRAYDILCFGAVLNLAATERQWNEFSCNLKERDDLRMIRDTARVFLPSIASQTPTKVVSLIQWCTEEKPTARPTGTEVTQALRAILG
jgi:tRNA A-37 threonylcarbamoyl transferase component Bud32